ncbi:hypothetical protein BGZ95_003921 [Linnemannia exigua]|uniref:F-box domain-containing protein n=1 Tax=Linnemannia exigua TaxID=604196 RepID=A0AAD4H131_9FUNG|nr:hypothetical protein BGZ95_003921 [Linnemannia exigua]
MNTAPNLPPEIMCLITHHLSRQDLVQIVRINKSWFSTCTPLLWRSIQILHPSRRLLFLSEPAQKAFLRHSRHVRSLQTRFFRPLRIFLEATDLCLDTIDILNNNLHSDVIDPCMSADSEALLIALLKKSPHLRTLRIKRSPKVSLPLLKTIATVLPRLQFLSLFCPQGMPWVSPASMKAFLEACSPEMEQLSAWVIVEDDQEEQMDATMWELKDKDDDSSGNSSDNSDNTDNSESSGSGNCTISSRDDSDGGSNHSSQDTPQSSHPALRMLCLSGYFFDHEEDVVVSFLRGCKNLQLIESPDEYRDDKCWITDNFRIRAAIEEATGLTLRRLTILPTGEGPDPNESEITDEDVSQLILDGQSKRSSGRREVWHTLHLEGNPLLGSLTADAILQTCTSGLVWLNVTGCQGIRGHHIQTILTTAVHLRNLDAGCRGDSEATDSRLDVSQILQSNTPWVCRSLRRLNVQICGFARPDLLRTGDLDCAIYKAALKESREVQQQIYRQIASLKYLEELCLGDGGLFPEDFVDVDELSAAMAGATSDVVWEPRMYALKYGNGHQTTCLELTLDSGLDILGALTELRVIDITRMKHRLGVDEMEWMEDHWPNLRTIKGLFSRSPRCPYAAIPSQDDRKRREDLVDWVAMCRPPWSGMDEDEIERYREKRSFHVCEGYESDSSI